MFRQSASQRREIWRRTTMCHYSRLFKKTKQKKTSTAGKWKEKLPERSDLSAKICLFPLEHLFIFFYTCSKNIFIKAVTILLVVYCNWIYCYPNQCHDRSSASASQLPHIHLKNVYEFSWIAEISTLKCCASVLKSSSQKCLSVSRSVFSWRTNQMTLSCDQKRKQLLQAALKKKNTGSNRK